MANIDLINISVFNATQIMQDFNTNTGGAFWSVFLVALFIIFISVMLGVGQSMKTSFLVSSFIIAISATLFATLQIITWSELIAFGSLLIFSILYSFVG